MSGGSQHSHQTTHTAASTSTSTSSSLPSPVETNVNRGYLSAERLIFREEFEKVQRWVDERIANINNIMGVILVVLALGFVTLIFSLWTVTQQSLNSFNQNSLKEELIKNANSNNELKKNLGTMRDELMKTQKILNILLTPSPTQ